MLDWSEINPGNRYYDLSHQLYWGWCFNVFRFTSLAIPWKPLWFFPSQSPFQFWKASQDWPEWSPKGTASLHLDDANNFRNAIWIILLGPRNTHTYTTHTWIQKILCHIAINWGNILWRMLLDHRNLSLLFHALMLPTIHLQCLIFLNLKKKLLVPLLHNLNLDGLLLLFRSPTSSTGRAHFNCRFYSRVRLVLYTVTRQFTYLSVCISLSMHHFVIFCDFNMDNIMRWNGTGGAQIGLWKYNSTVEEINLPIEFSVGPM